VSGFYWERHPDGPFATLIAVTATSQDFAGPCRALAGGKAWLFSMSVGTGRSAGPRIQPALGNPRGVEHLDHLPLLAYALITAGHGWFVYGRKPVSGSEIEREIERQARAQR
jgi:hypothetical protein